MTGFPKINSIYASRKHPDHTYKVVSIAEPLRLSGGVIETKIVLIGNDGKTYHTTLWQLTQELKLVYPTRNPESAPRTDYPKPEAIPTGAFRAWETEV